MQTTRCEVCAEGVAKYRCPGCAIRTCSLPCVKTHKHETDCSGNRDKTAYIALRNFTDQNLLSDYRLLEDVDRKADSISRDTRRKHRTLPKHLNTFMRMARQRKVTVKILPYVFTRRKINSSMFSTKDREILWHIEWIFPQSEVKYSDKRVSESTLLSKVLEKYLDPVTADPVIRQRLKKYVSAGYDNIRLFMKVERRSAKSVRYHLLDLNQTIADNLADKYIIEYPTIFVVLAENFNAYPLLGEVPTDDENASSSSSDSDSSSSSSEDSSESDEISGDDDSVRDSHMTEECRALCKDPDSVDGHDGKLENGQNESKLQDQSRNEDDRNDDLKEEAIGQ